MKKQLILLLILFFLFNLFWEVAHSSLYDWNLPSLQNNVPYYISRILLSTFGDFIILSFMFIVISLKNRSYKWLNKPSKMDYVIIVLLGISFAIVIEINAFIKEKWHYTKFMPTLFDIGVTPLLQLFVTALLALWLVKE